MPEYTEHHRRNREQPGKHRQRSRYGSRHQQTDDQEEAKEAAKPHLKASRNQFSKAALRVIKTTDKRYLQAGGFGKRHQAFDNGFARSVSVRLDHADGVENLAAVVAYKPPADPPASGRSRSPSNTETGSRLARGSVRAWSKTGAGDNTRPVAGSASRAL